MSSVVPVDPCRRSVGPPAAADPPQSQPQPQPPPAEAPLALHGRVLLAEDNAVNAMLARTVIEAAGLVVAVVDDGWEAVTNWDTGYPDLVLMDCQMPRMDGYDATRRIRAREREAGRPHVPIVALTANAYGADLERCRAAGMDGHLAKPFRREELIALLERYLSG